MERLLSLNGAVALYAPNTVNINNKLKDIARERKLPYRYFIPYYDDYSGCLDYVYEHIYDENVFVFHNPNMEHKIFRKFSKFISKQSDREGLIILCGRTEGFKKLALSMDIPIIEYEDKGFNIVGDILTYNGERYKNFGSAFAKTGDIVIFKEDFRNTIAGIPYETSGTDQYISERGNFLFTSGWGGKDKRDVYKKI